MATSPSTGTMGYGTRDCPRDQGSPICTSSHSSWGGGRGLPGAEELQHRSKGTEGTGATGSSSAEANSCSPQPAHQGHAPAFPGRHQLTPLHCGFTLMQERLETNDQSLFTILGSLSSYSLHAPPKSFLNSSIFSSCHFQITASLLLAPLSQVSAWCDCCSASLYCQHRELTERRCC